MRSRPSPERRAQDRFADYFQEAAMLRLCLAYNEEDHAFAERGGRINYVFDANIVRFFIDPVSEEDHVKAFRATDLDYSAATAVITAEFLFSRALSGQDALPAYIAPGHGEELADFVERNVESVGLSAEEEPHHDSGNHEAVIAMLENVVEEVEYGDGKEMQNLVGRLRQLVPHLAEGELATWSAFHQLARLHEEDLIRPLSLHSACNNEILWPGKSQVRDWAKRIQAERIDHRHTVGRKNERDAEALVQVMELDRAARVDGDASANRFVLVTADNALFDAYAKWFWNENSDRTARFLLRKPLQYVPALNSLDMPNSVDDDGISNMAVDALDSLFNNLRTVEASYPNKLAYYRILAREPEIHDRLRSLYGVDPLIFGEGVTEDYGKLRDIWHGTFRTGVLLNLNLMQRRYAAQLERLFDIIDSDRPLQQVIREDMQRNLERIQVYHARFSTRLNLATLLEQALEVRGAEAVIPRERIPFLLRTGGMDLPNGFGELLMVEPSPADLRGLVRRCAGDLRNKTPFETMFAAAAIAYRCDHWGAARLYARTCLSLHPASATDLTELEHILAVSTRQGLGVVQEDQVSAEEIEDAEVALEQSVFRCEREGDLFGNVRAILEQMSLRLIVQRRSVLLGEAGPELARAERLIENAPSLPRLLNTLLSMDLGPEETKLLPHLAARAEALTYASFILARLRTPAEELDIELTAQLQPLVSPTASISTLDHPITSIVRARRVASEQLRNLPMSGPTLSELQEAIESDPWSSELDRAEIARIIEVTAPIPAQLA